MDYRTWYTLPMTDYRTWNTTDDTGHNTDFYKDECDKRSKQRKFIYGLQVLQPARAPVGGRRACNGGKITYTVIFGPKIGGGGVTASRA